LNNKVNKIFNKKKDITRKMLQYFILLLCVHGQSLNTKMAIINALPVEGLFTQMLRNTDIMYMETNSMFEQISIKLPNYNWWTRTQISVTNNLQNIDSYASGFFKPITRNENTGLYIIPMSYTTTLNQRSAADYQSSQDSGSWNITATVCVERDNTGVLIGAYGDYGQSNLIQWEWNSYRIEFNKGCTEIRTGGPLSGMYIGYPPFIQGYLYASTDGNNVTITIKHWMMSTLNRHNMRGCECHN
jgi:hypothetical protein